MTLPNLYLQLQPVLQLPSTFQVSALAGKTADIQAAWKKLWADLQHRPAKMKMAFVARDKRATSSTSAYKFTFPYSSAQLDAFCETARLKTELQTLITQFVEDVFLKTINAKTGQPVFKNINYMFGDALHSWYLCGMVLAHIALVVRHSMFAQGNALTQRLKCVMFSFLLSFLLLLSLN